MEADDDDYQEIDSSLVPNQDEEFFFQMDDIHATGPFTCNRFSYHLVTPMHLQVLVSGKVGRSLRISKINMMI